MTSQFRLANTISTPSVLRLTPTIRKSFLFSWAQILASSSMGKGSVSILDPTSNRMGTSVLSPRFQFNRVTLPAGSFNASIFGARVSYAFTTRFFTKLFAQWNSDDNVISTNFLLNYIYRPGSDFYLVFNQTYDTTGSSTRLEESTFVGKMTYWWNP